MPQELNGWLGSLLLYFRHVDVIDKYGDGLVGPRTEESLTFLV